MILTKDDVNPNIASLQDSQIVKNLKSGYLKLNEFKEAIEQEDMSMTAMVFKFGIVYNNITELLKTTIENLQQNDRSTK